LERRVPTAAASSVMLWGAASAVSTGRGAAGAPAPPALAPAAAGAWGPPGARLAL